MDLQLKGKAVLLVGGTRGIGLATARLLAEEGARVAVVARDSGALEKAKDETRRAGVEAVPVAADITDAGQSERAVREAVEALGSLDVLIHAVGKGFPGAFMEVDEERWQQAFELDFFSVVRMVRLAVPHMKSGSRITLLGAASAKQPRFEASLSNTAKAALLNLTVSLADELAPKGICVNSVGPGRVLTERRRQRLEKEGRDRGLSFEDALCEDATDIPLGRLGEPEEVATVAVFVSSPRAGYITGQSILVDGGLVRVI